MRLFRGFKSSSKTSQELLNNVQIASPCSVSWESMTGDDQIRFCGQCEKSVYDLSTMSADAAVDLIREKQGKMCIQIYRRVDGTVLTEDCPRGLKRLKQAMAKKVACALAALGWLGFTGAASAQSQAGEEGTQSAPISASEPACGRTRGELIFRPRNTNPTVADPQPLAGKIAPNSVQQIVTQKPLEGDCCPDKMLMRILFGLVAIGGALGVSNKFKRQRIWIVGIAVVITCAVFGLTWL